MTHECEGATLGQLLQQPQRKLLAVIFDGFISLIYRTILKQLAFVTQPERCPCDLTGLKRFEQAPCLGQG
jgi:hypothetical protein